MDLFSSDTLSSHEQFSLTLQNELNSFQLGCESRLLALEADNGRLRTKLKLQDALVKTSYDLLVSKLSESDESFEENTAISSMRLGGQRAKWLSLFATLEGEQGEVEALFQKVLKVNADIFVSGFQIWTAPNLFEFFIELVTPGDASPALAVLAPALYGESFTDLFEIYGDVKLVKEWYARDRDSFLDKYDRFPEYVAEGAWERIFGNLPQGPPPTEGEYLAEEVLEKGEYAVETLKYPYGFYTMHGGTSYPFNRRYFPLDREEYRCAPGKEKACTFLYNDATNFKGTKSYSRSRNRYRRKLMEFISGHEDIQWEW